MQNGSSARVFSLQFWLLCLSSFLFFASFNMLIPELPTYLTSMGGAEYKGSIIGLFTLTAGLSRPFSGRLTDRIGRVPVMAFGSLVCFGCGLLYPVFATVMPFLLLRVVHGFSTGFKPTGTGSYIADIIPADRRGEALGIHGMCAGTGSAFGPALGSWIAQVFSLNALFYTSSAFALGSIAILINMKETLVEPERFSVKTLALNWSDVFEPAVLAPSVVTFLCYFSFGAVATISPDFSEHLGLQNRGYYFLVFTITSILVRLAAGKISDRHGRIQGAITGSGILVVALLLTAYATSPLLFLTGAAFYGIATGILSPVLSAWTIDLSQDHNRGRAMATMYIALEAGIGLGAYLSALIFANHAENFAAAFLAMTALAVAAFVYSILLYINKKRHRRAV
jgi:MFS family permease